MAEEKKAPKTILRKKLSVEKLELAKQEPGFKFQGKYVGTAESEPFSKVNDKGEIVSRTITFAIFEREDGSRFKVARDKGLYTAMADAMVKEGQTVEVVKLGKTGISNSRTMNQYDIFDLGA